MSNSNARGFRCIDVKGLTPKFVAYTERKGSGNPTWYSELSVV